jgi:hypothetical protein
MHEKLKELNKKGNNPEKQENTKNTTFPLGAGETTKGELCGSLTYYKMRLLFFFWNT